VEKGCSDNLKPLEDALSRTEKRVRPQSGPRKRRTPRERRTRFATAELDWPKEGEGRVVEAGKIGNSPSLRRKLSSDAIKEGKGRGQKVGRNYSSRGKRAQLERERNAPRKGGD